MHRELFTGMYTCIGTGDLLLRMGASWENFVVHLRTSRARSEPFLSTWQNSVNSFSSHTMNTLAEVFLCSEQFYMHKNTSGSVFIVWELKELAEYCQLLKKGSERALEVRRCTTNFSHLAHMRRRRSPVPMQVYIPVNSSLCIRTLPQVYSSCESWKS